MDLLVHQVNAFTAEGQNGNPAGIVLDADSLTRTQMQSIAARVGFSETAFVKTSDTATYKLQFFTPTEEVDLCGHATIATWSWMYQQGIVDAGHHAQETLAGILGITIQADGLVFMEQAGAQFYEEIPIPVVAPLLGIKAVDFHAGLAPQIVSTGLRDLLVPVTNSSVLTNLQPDYEQMAAFSKQHAITGLHVFSIREHGSYLADARNFAPAVGIPEECATGTSNGALLCYLKHHGALPTQPPYRIEQGAAMGQPSHIFGKFDDEKVWIGGMAAYKQTNKVTV